MSELIKVRSDTIKTMDFSSNPYYGSNKVKVDAVNLSACLSVVSITINDYMKRVGISDKDSYDYLDIAASMMISNDPSDEVFNMSLNALSDAVDSKYEILSQIDIMSKSGDELNSCCNDLIELKSVDWKNKLQRTRAVHMFVEMIDKLSK